MIGHDPADAVCNTVVFAATRALASVNGEHRRILARYAWRAWGRLQGCATTPAAELKATAEQRLQELVSAGLVNVGQ